jgi:hypothetical protein
VRKGHFSSPWEACLRPEGGKVFVSREKGAFQRIMEGKRVIILGLLLFFIICIILMTLWMVGYLS